MSSRPFSSPDDTSHSARTAHVTPYQYQEFGRYFAQVAHPVEHVGAAELEELGATNVEPAYRGVYFDATPEVLYGVVFGTRMATRILAPLMTFDCHSDNYLYKRVSEIDWVSLIGPDRTFAVFASLSNSWLSHSQYASLRVKDAIVDTIRAATGDRPDIDRREPDLWINLHVENNRATLSLDASGGSLHRRGYRVESVEAPLQETVAATLVRLADWKAERPLVDPMCGSGTLLAEAWLVAANAPAGLLQESFGFEQFPDFDAWTWASVRAARLDAMKPVPEGLISGSDISAAAVAAARANLARLPGAETVRVQKADFRSTGPIKDSTIICNPPYGRRIGGGMPIEGFYKAFGDFLKQECTGCTAYIYVGKPELLKGVGLRTSFRKEVVNGALEGRLARYDLY
ncbi:MAG: RNA methyltransferase [Bacteroidetes bacterium CG12_big_fil_rev_8_21_14_0_65_60_17]|nr:MAG: RNA methyltransferase [Bacteroidetes bacterium CG12_big_fil_rev_8_21_14_0_65_60_17]